MILSLEESVALEARHKFNTCFKEGSLYTVNISHVFYSHTHTL